MKTCYLGVCGGGEQILNWSWNWQGWAVQTENTKTMFTKLGLGLRNTVLKLKIS